MVMSEGVAVSLTSWWTDGRGMRDICLSAESYHINHPTWAQTDKSWELSTITYNSIWHPRAKRQSTQMNYWKYEPSPAEVPAWECINLNRQQTDIVRYSLAQHTSNSMRDLCICLSWSSSRIPIENYFVQFSSALTDCQSDKAEDVRAAGGHYKVYCSQSTEMIFRSQTGAQRGSSSVITTYWADWLFEQQYIDCSSILGTYM